jgi:hypothetical protein
MHRRFRQDTGKKNRVEYVFDLSSPHEEIRWGQTSIFGKRVAHAYRFGRHITSFYASSAQSTRISRRDGKIRVYTSQLSGNVP